MNQDGCVTEYGFIKDQYAFSLAECGWTWEEGLFSFPLITGFSSLILITIAASWIRISLPRYPCHSLAWWFVGLYSRSQWWNGHPSPLIRICYKSHICRCLLLYGKNIFIPTYQLTGLHITTLWGNYGHDHLASDEETAAQKSSVIVLRSHWWEVAEPSFQFWHALLQNSCS